MESCVSELRVRAPPLTEIRTLRAAHGDYLRLGLRVTDHGARKEPFAQTLRGLCAFPPAYCVRTTLRYVVVARARRHRTCLHEKDSRYVRGVVSRSRSRDCDYGDRIKTRSVRHRVNVAQPSVVVGSTIGVSPLADTPVCAACCCSRMIACESLAQNPTITCQ